MSFRNLALAILMATTLGACAVAPPAPVTSNQQLATSHQQLEEYCEDIRAGLPTSDPRFGLRGRVTTLGFERFTHEITQFGKTGVYREYFVVADAANGAYCGHIPFYQISRAEYQPKTMTYVITLKNGKSFQTRTNIPFAYRAPDSQRAFTILVGGLDPERDSWFWYITVDPRFKEPREISLEGTRIATLEVY